MLPLDFRPQKKKGQNFLIDRNIVNKIIKATSPTKRDIVLEIGPGQGILIGYLANQAKRVIAVELDKKLYHYLQSTLKNVNNINLINGDILKFNIADFSKKEKFKQKITLIGNIPYSITTPILEYIFKNITFFGSVFLMVQKEFALRLTAKPNTKDYSSISCFAQFYVNPKLLFSVKRTCFKPKPKVDSCFIQLVPRKADFWQDELKPKDEELLFKVIQTAFNQRRKTISNSLSPILDKGKLADIFSKLKIKPNSRAENLSIQEFIKISNLCFDNFNSGLIIRRITP